MIDEDKLADLLISALEGRNRRRPKHQIVVKPKVVVKDFVVNYLRSVMRGVVNNPSAYAFGELGHMQVVEHVSEKGYEWDKKYDARDWSVVWDHGQPFAQVKIDEVWNAMAARKVEKGMRYNISIVQHGK